MFLRRAHYRHPAFALGVREMWQQNEVRVDGRRSVLMTVLVFAGSSQLAAIPLIVAAAPAWVILATGFCVNLRFVVFSLHLRPYLMHLPRWERMVHGYLTADLSYVIFTRRFATPAADASVETRPFLDFSSGYVQRAIEFMPRQGAKAPWKLYQNYLLDLLTLRYRRIADGTLRFARKG